MVRAARPMNGLEHCADRGASGSVAQLTVHSVDDPGLERNPVLMVGVNVIRFPETACLPGSPPK